MIYLLALPVIGALLLGALLLKAPFVPTRLQKFPSVGSLYLQILRSTLTKKELPADLVGPPIEVQLSAPAPFDAGRYATYLKLVGFKDIPPQIPLSYPFVESFRLSMLAMAHKDFPFNILGAVLARNSSSVSRPLAASESLSYSASIDPRYVRNDKGDIEINIICTGTDTSGVEVYKNILTVIVINPKRQRGGGAKKTADEAAAEPTPQLLADLSVPANAGRLFGALSGDRNPIHIHPLLSSLFGFKKPIAHAMYLVGRLEAELHNAGFKVKSFPASFSTEFKRPTPLPAKLQAVVFPQQTPPLQCAVKTGDGAKDVIVGRLISSS